MEKKFNDQLKLIVLQNETFKVAHAKSDLKGFIDRDEFIEIRMKIDLISKFTM